MQENEKKEENARAEMSFDAFVDSNAHLKKSFLQ